MKRVLPLLVLATMLACPLHAQEGAPQVLSTTTGTPPANQSKTHTPHGDRLTPEEMEKLHQAHDAVMKANPALDAEGKDLKEQMRAHEKKVNDAMIKADPSLAPLIAKMEKERMMHPHGGPGGPPPPPDGGN